MTTNGDTEPAPDRVTVVLRSPSQSPWAVHDAALEFGQFQMLLSPGQPTVTGASARFF